jgi:hypothetical protein
VDRAVVDRAARRAPDGFAAAPVRGFVRAAAPARGFVRAAPPARGFVRAAPPARGFVRAAPPARGFVRAAPPAREVDFAAALLGVFFPGAFFLAAFFAADFAGRLGFADLCGLVERFGFAFLVVFRAILVLLPLAFERARV